MLETNALAGGKSAGAGAYGSLSAASMSRSQAAAAPNLAPVAVVTTNLGDGFELQLDPVAVVNYHELRRWS